MKSQELYPPEIWVKWYDEDGYYEAWDKTSFPTILNAVRYDRSESATTIDSMIAEAKELGYEIWITREIRNKHVVWDARYKNFHDITAAQILSLTDQHSAFAAALDAVKKLEGEK